MGIAQALIHRLNVLILDEPVSGLDPVQRREIRELIRTLGEGDTTVLLSTHVLAEIEAICHRVLIIDEGRLLQDSSIDSIRTAHARVLLRVERGSSELQEQLLGLPLVHEVNQLDDGAYEIKVSGDARAKIAELPYRAAYRNYVRLKP